MRSVYWWRRRASIRSRSAAWPSTRSNTRRWRKTPPRAGARSGCARSSAGSRRPGRASSSATSLAALASAESSPRALPRAAEWIGASAIGRPRRRAFPLYGALAARPELRTVRRVQTVKLELVKGLARPLRGGHPWGCRRGTERAPAGLPAGSIVDVMDRSRFVARGYYDPTAAIAVRVLTRDPAEAVTPIF